MSKFPEFPKGKIKKNRNFYMWASVAAMVILIGVITVIEKEFTFKESPPIRGDLAVIIGLFYIILSVYFLYHLFFKAEAEERSHDDFHELENFEDNIDGYEVKFKVLESAIAAYRSSTVRVVYYVLKVTFSKSLYINLNIKKRDRVEYFLWKIGLTRYLDVLTGNYYFDSRYRVQCSNRELFFIVFSRNVIQQLEKFDRDYPPIRAKNGILTIEDDYIEYVEGPYNEDWRLFDPHRGKIEDLFKELTPIISSIKSNLPDTIDEEVEKNKIAKIRKEIKERKVRRERISNLFLTTYRAILYVLLIGGFSIVTLYNLLK